MIKFTDKARPYLAMGWKVFPVQPDSRMFFSKDRYPEFGGQGGFYWATADWDWIERWERELGAYCNLAVRTGSPSGIVCVDVDFGKPNVDPRTVLDLLAAEGKRFPETPAVARSPSGGEHWYYRYLGPLRCSVGRLGADLLPRMASDVKISSGVDIKADGGLAYLAPSNVEGKGHYDWIECPWTQEGRISRLPPLPRWVMEELAPPEPPKRTYQRRDPDYAELGLERIERRLDWVRNEVEGERNATLYRQYCRALDYGHSPSQIGPHFQQAALDAGLTLREIAATMRQAEKPANRRDPKLSNRG